MNPNSNSATIPVAEDDHDDGLLIKEAFPECGFHKEPWFDEESDELMDYLVFSLFC